jgi:hypothetical protein
LVVRGNIESNKKAVNILIDELLEWGSIKKLKKFQIIIKLYKILINYVSYRNLSVYVQLYYKYLKIINLYFSKDMGKDKK